MGYAHAFAVRSQGRVAGGQGSSAGPSSRHSIPTIQAFQVIAVGYTIPPPHHGVVMNGAGGELGDDELQFQYMQRGWVTGWESGFDRSPIGWVPNITIPVGFAPNLNLTLPDIAPREIVPPMDDGKEYYWDGERFVEVRDAPYYEPAPAWDWETWDRENPGQTGLPPPVVFADIPVIDPEFEPTVTVGETSSGDPVAVEQERRPVAFWDTVSDIFTTTSVDYASQWVDSYFKPVAQAPVFPAPLTTPGFASGPGAAPYAASVASKGTPIVQDQQLCAVPAAQPRYLRYNCQTGQYSKVPRRRRRRLLTSSDLKDLAALKAIVGGGAKMDGAIVQAIRR